MTVQSRRSFLTLSASALGAAAFAGEALAQVYYEERVVRRRRRAPLCRPMCPQDMSPCDSPALKAADGRRSSPSAGFVG